MNEWGNLKLKIDEQPLGRARKPYDVTLKNVVFVTHFEI